MSWANQTRVLSERFKELLTILGSGLIQILTPVVQLLNMLISRIIDFANMLSSVISSLTGGEKKQLEMQGASEQIAANNQSAADSAGDLADNITEAGNAAKKSLASFDTLSIITASMAGSVSNLEDSMLSSIPILGSASNTNNQGDILPSKEETSSFQSELEKTLL